VLEEDEPWLISWRSLPGSQIDNAGSVQFRVAGAHATELRVSLAYKPPAGPLGVLLARALREEPHLQVRADLERFRRVLESPRARAGRPVPGTGDDRVTARSVLPEVRRGAPRRRTSVPESTAAR
jgi:uncharacterized membrane protein